MQNAHTVIHTWVAFSTIEPSPNIGDVTVTSSNVRWTLYIDYWPY